MIALIVSGVALIAAVTAAVLAVKLRRQTSRNTVLAAANTALTQEVRRVRRFLDTYRTWTGQNLTDIWPDVDTIDRHRGGDQR